MYVTIQLFQQAAAGVQESNRGQGLCSQISRVSKTSVRQSGHVPTEPGAQKNTSFI